MQASGARREGAAGGKGRRSQVEGNGCGRERRVTVCVCVNAQHVEVTLTNSRRVILEVSRLANMDTRQSTRRIRRNVEEESESIQLRSTEGRSVG